MFEGVDFGNVGNDQLKFLTEFIGGKDIDLKSQYSQKAIETMVIFDGYVNHMKKYYDKDFILFSWWEDVVNQLTRRMVSLNRKSRDEIKEIAKGIFEDTSAKDFVRMFDNK